MTYGLSVALDNAKFVVCAVNSHAELKAALAACAEELTANTHYLTGMQQASTIKIALLARQALANAG